MATEKEITIKAKLGGRKAFIHLILMALITGVLVFIAHKSDGAISDKIFEIYCYAMVGLGISFSGGNGLEHLGKKK